MTAPFRSTDPALTQGDLATQVHVLTLGDLLANPPDFVRQPQVAAEMIDPAERIMTRREVPCICPEQANGACGRTTAYSNAFGRVREQVQCDRCPRTWTRVNC